MLKKELLEILVCPKCKGELEYAVDKDNHTKGKLICHKCSLAFKVEDDIPVMLIDEAESIKES